MSKEFVSLGIIKGSFGLEGCAKIMSTTTQGEKRYLVGNKLFLLNENDESLKEVTVKDYRTNNGTDFVSFLEINSKEDIESFKGFKVVVEKNQNDLEKGKYFFSDLEKCQVIDQNNQVIGKVIQVEEFPAQITLRVKGQNGNDFFVPFIKDFIINVDIEKFVIKVNVVEGMLWR